MTQTAIDRFAYPRYLIRRKIFKIFGGAFHVYDPDGNVCFYSKQKAFKLKEDIRVYTDETMQQEVLLIAARSIIDFSAAYDVIDATTGEKVGALRRKGFSSIFRDEWTLLDVNDQPVARVREDSMALALVRRFLSNLVPQTFYCEADGQRLWRLRQNFNPFVLKIALDFDGDPDVSIDRRLGIAAAILLSAIEGRQQS
jgi:uncharacterized protein YxjI